MMAWLKSTFHSICAIMREINGDDMKRLSQMRICGFMTVTVILGVFIWKNMQAASGVMVDFPDNAGYIMASVVLGKVAQKFVEQRWGGSTAALTQDPAPPAILPEEPCPKTY